MRQLLTTTAFLTIAAAPVAAQSGAGPTALADAVSGNQVTVADLLDRTVYVRTGADDQLTWSDWTDVPDTWQASGEIDDLLLGEDGSVQTAVLSRGGLLDIGDTEVQVDIGKFGIVKDADGAGGFFVVYTGKPAGLKSAQPFEGPGEGQTSAMKRADRQAEDAAQASAGSGPDTGGPAAADSARKMTHEASPAAPKTGTEQSGAGAAMTAGSDNAQGAADVEAEPVATAGVKGASNTGVSSDQKVMGANAGASEQPLAAGETSISGVSAEQLQDMPVYTSDDARVGEIGKLERGPDGNVSSAIVRMGGFLGFGETPVAVPAEKITVKRHAGDGQLRAYVDMTKDAMNKLQREASRS